MHTFSPKPHVSPALAHLRHGVTAAALAVALFAAVQMLVFGFVHFTQVRWVESQIPSPSPALRVVAGSQPQVAAARDSEPAPVVVEEEPEKELGKADRVLNAMSDFAVAGGVGSSALLVMLTMLGVVIAAGGAVPGVDRAASSAVWASLIAVGCLPWQTVLPSVPFAGVFGPYATMTALSDGGQSGSNIALVAHFLVMPLAAMCAAFLVLYRFRAGIAEGIIVTAVSELDERLEREVTLRSRPSEPRAVAALNSAIGAAPEPVPVAASAAPADSVLRKRPVQALPPVGDGPGKSWLRRERSMGQTDPGDPLKRPI